ncbi:unnamed protein product [Amoebophrya sp. A120]|nr:unnamed protein product [Amoebophrya sp. A120]|eukprot:GSA120T00024401001.1
MGATSSGRYGSTGSVGDDRRGTSPTGGFLARSPTSSGSRAPEVEEGDLLQRSNSGLQERRRPLGYQTQLRVMVQRNISNNAANFPAAGVRAGSEPEPGATTPPTPWPTNETQQQVYGWAVPPSFFEFGIGG